MLTQFLDLPLGAKLWCAFALIAAIGIVLYILTAPRGNADKHDGPPVPNPRLSPADELRYYGAYDEAIAEGCTVNTATNNARDALEQILHIRKLKQAKEARK